MFGQCKCVPLLTHGWLVMAQQSAAVVVFEQRSKHLWAHLRLPPQRHVGSHHFVVRVQVVTGGKKIEKKRSYVDKYLIN